MKTQSIFLGTRAESGVCSYLQLIRRRGRLCVCHVPASGFDLGASGMGLRGLLGCFTLSTSSFTPPNEVG